MCSASTNDVQTRSEARHQSGLKRYLLILAVCVFLMFAPVAVTQSGEQQQAAIHAPPDVRSEVWEWIRLIGALLIGGGGGGYLALRKWKTDGHADAATNAVIASQAVIAKVNSDMIAALRDDIAYRKHENEELRQRMIAQHSVIRRQMREIAELSGHSAPEFDPVTEAHPEAADSAKRN